MLIRRWNENDNAAIAELEKICFKYYWTQDMIADAVAMDNFIGFVLCDESGSIHGYAGAINAGQDADIALIAVAPEFRRKGYAKRMLGELFSNLAALGVENVYLEVRVDNINARSLYEKSGFLPVGIRKKYYEDGSDAIVMLKEINVGK